MKPRKMTNAELSTALEETAWGSPVAMNRVRAHIAALEAKRDDYAIGQETLRRALGDATRERDALRDQLKVVGDALSEAQGATDALRERVQVLEASLDESSEQGREWLRERDEARERVRALEDDVRRMNEHMHCEAERHRSNLLRADAAESRLSAIRQRAGDEETLANVASEQQTAPDAYWGGIALAVARYVVGEDVSTPVEGNLKLPSNSAPTAPPKAFTHEKGMDAGTFEEASSVRAPVWTSLTDKEWSDVIEEQRRHESAVPEPTTAEAFATVRRLADWASAQDADTTSFDGTPIGPPLSEARFALSLLERRMGAVWRTFVEEMAHWPTCPSGNDFSDAGWARCDCHMGQIRALLTDVPPVFTLEEIRNAVSDEFVVHPTDAKLDSLANRLSALRK